MCNIAILSIHSSPLGQPGEGDTGGMSIYIRELTRELVKLGNSVDIYTRVQSPTTPEVIEIAPGARQIHILAGEPADIDKLLVYDTAPDFACRTESFRKTHDLKYDMIFSHYWISGIAGQYLQIWWQVPHLVMFHTLGAVKNAIGIGEDEPDLRIEEERQVALTCHRIIASTEKEKVALFRFYDVPPEKVSVIPCGVNFDLFKPMDKAAARQKLGLGSDKIILFVGRIERLKGIDRIIQSLPFLGDVTPRLIIAGEDGNRPGEAQKLRNLAENLGVGKSVSFIGRVDYSELPVYYNAADVCAFPSFYESFGLVPLESLACGTPVVATDVGDLKNIIIEGQTGYVIAGSHPPLLADRLGQILRHQSPELGSQTAIRGSILRYSWKNIAREIQSHCSRMVSPRPALV
ncbi:MAG TPA: glycosyltransferase [Dehalococcoidales bacterium]|nr:glycosyltransferase [Dehalococcoidales bacterium]